MKIEIVTPDSTIFTGEISLAQFPGIDGSFEVLNNHAPLIAALKKGRIKLAGLDKQLKYFDVNGGIVEVLRNSILVLAE
jgi:F-type H+-transporting ATPase subunit epsilon